MTVHARVAKGQVWQSNDPRELRAVRVLGIAGAEPGVLVENVQTARRTWVRRDRFATGPRGWSLLREAR